MRILVIADIDDLHWEYGRHSADVLLSCGDVFDRVILEAAEACACQAIFAVKGNHDRPTPFPSPIIDIHLQIREYSGLKFGGYNGSWRYKPRGSFLYGQEEVQASLEHFPSVDIFLSHNSPEGVHDKHDGIHYGFQAFNEYIAEKHPKALIHGHQHRDVESVLKETRVIGAYGFKIVDV